MAENKTTYTGENVIDFIDTFVEKEPKKKDSLELLSLLEEWSGWQPEMWGPSIIGFGNYHYKYASGREGDAPILGFSPRKTAFSLYVFSDNDKNNDLLTKLGKFKMGKSCIYVNKLADIDLAVLKQMCLNTIEFINENPDFTC